ncbi:MAG: hypothetical protein ABSC22_16105 [Roseiarcus sp.]|jgi:hypothetical protein
MPFSIVSRVAFNSDAARARGEPKRPSATPQQSKSADAPAFTGQDLEADPSDGEDVGSTAGLSILAQALAAYSQN